jgi:hypothetical protein
MQIYFYIKPKTKEEIVNLLLLFSFALAYSKSKYAGQLTTAVAPYR